MTQKTLEEIIKIMTVHDSPVSLDRLGTREELERRASEEAKEEANQAYDTAYDDAYRRILEDRLEEYGLSEEP